MRSPPLLKYFPYYQHTTVVCGGGGLNKYQRHRADAVKHGAAHASRWAAQWGLEDVMGYRNKTYVIFDGDKNMWAYRYMRGWNSQEHMDFNFYDAHDLRPLTDRAS